MKPLGVLLALSGLTLAMPGGKPPLSPAEAAEEAQFEVLNYKLSRDYFFSLAAFTCVLIGYRVITAANQYVRTVACMSSDTQRYFTLPCAQWGKFKSAVLYAPLFRTRHNREFRLSSAVNMGTLPSRFQALSIGAVVGTNVALCAYGIPKDTPAEKALVMVRNRTGTISVANLIPMVLLAGRNNPLIQWLDVSFDSFNLMHRWLGRLVILEAIAHTLCWMISKVERGGWSAVEASIKGSSFIWTGLIGTIAFVVILIQSPSPIRHAFYETFLHLHVALVILAFVGLWTHLSEYPQQGLLLAAILAWVFDRGLRFVRLLYRNVGLTGTTKASVEALAGDAIRVTFDVTRPWRVRPGQHIYVTIPSIGLWTSHPFSIAWSDTTLQFNRALDLGEKNASLVSSYRDLQSMKSSTVSVIIRRRTGFTDALYKCAEKAGAYDDNFDRSMSRSTDTGTGAGAGAGNRLTLNAFIEGPYGCSRPMSSYGTVLLFAAGAGITHQIPYVRQLVSGYAAGTVAARRVSLVWIVRSPEHLEWIRPWMTQILAMEQRRDVLAVQLFITRPRNMNEVVSPSATVQMYPGRPRVDTLVAKECQAQMGAMAVTVCGSGGLADDVRKAVRSHQRWSNVDFVEENFSW